MCDIILLSVFVSRQESVVRLVDVVTRVSSSLSPLRCVLVHFLVLVVNWTFLVNYISQTIETWNLYSVRVLQHLLLFNHVNGNLSVQYCMYFNICFWYLIISVRLWRKLHPTWGLHHQPFLSKILCQLDGMHLWYHVSA